MAEISKQEEPPQVSAVQSFPEKVQMTDEERELTIALQEYVPGTEEEKRLVRKVDMWMIPALWFMYILAYIDRQNVGNAKVGGMYKDLKLTDDGYAMIVSIFFIGYLCCEVPSSLVLTRSRPSWYLSIIMILWGTLCACIAAVPSYSAILAIRFFLGCIEAGFFPGVLYVMTCWYKKNEIGKRFSIFFTASLFSGALSGIMAGAIISSLDGVHGIAGWRWLFLIEGVITVGFAICAKFIILDYPQHSTRLTLSERQLAVVRILHDRQTSAARSNMRLTYLQAIFAAVADPRTYLFMTMVILDLGACTISYFIPTIINQMGYSSTTAQWMTVPIWMVGLVFVLGISFSADKTRDRRWHISACLLVSFVCCIVCVTTNGAVVRYVMICFFIGTLYTAYPLLLNWTSEVIELPPEKRAVVVALVNSVGNLASVYGSRLWPSADAPKYTLGFAFTAACLGFSSLLAALIPIILKYLPKEGFTPAEKEILRREEEINNSQGIA